MAAYFFCQSASIHARPAAHFESIAVFSDVAKLCQTLADAHTSKVLGDAPNPLDLEIRVFALSRVINSAYLLFHGYTAPILIRL